MSPTTRASRTTESTAAEEGGEGVSHAPVQGTAPANRISGAFSMNGETAEEIVGGYVPASTEATTLSVDDAARHESVSGTGSSTEFDVGPAATESATGEESGLESVPGYERTESSAALAESSIPEAFTADAEIDSKEFLPILVKLAPVIASTVLPIIKRRVLNRRTLGKVGAALGTAKAIAGKLFESEAIEAEEAEAMEAEFEAAAEQMEVIIGTDDRVRIRQTSVVPWRRICHLTIRARNGQQYVGTGFLIGKRTVITAGHCVYIHSAGGWPAYIDVAPGRNGATRPFGTVRGVAFRSVVGWVNNKSRDYDYGAIILPPTTPSPVQSLGGFGFGYWPDHQLQNRMVNLSGYPGDGGKLGPDRETGSQWWMARQVKSVSPRSFAYDIDTMGGQSGSPVWTLYNGQRIVLGIHTNGFVGGNSATRVTQPVFNNLKAWREQGS